MTTPKAQRLPLRDAKAWGSSKKSDGVKPTAKAEDSGAHVRVGSFCWYNSYAASDWRLALSYWQRASATSREARAANRDEYALSRPPRYNDGLGRWEEMRRDR